MLSFLQYNRSDKSLIHKDFAAFGCIIYQWFDLIVRGLAYAERFLNDGTAGAARNCVRAAIA